jgi:glycerol-3-phosphate dehydrogenase
MDRAVQWQQLITVPEWDVIIIGGGATGLASAMDAASRGWRTLLVERHDFAKGTSSRATKLVHGGVRYLAQGNIRLVKEALAERAWLLRQAPHICHPLSFVIPVYRWWQKWYYGIGLWLYETLSFRRSLGATRLLSKAATEKALPGVAPAGLKGGVLYYDGQFDDARLAIAMAQTAIQSGATVLNHVTVTGFIQDGEKLAGVVVRDEISGERVTCKGKVIINATGVFADAILQLAERHAAITITPSQGVHIVIDKKYLPGQSALMIPKTSDGRVLFAIPWQNHLLIGTTDTPIDRITDEPLALPEEIGFILDNLNRYTNEVVTRSDIRTLFAGLRPLAKTGTGKVTAVMPRDHQVQRLASGLIHITGGKWTTCRRMAEDAINLAQQFLPGSPRPCVTPELQVYGYTTETGRDHLGVYGTAAAKIRALQANDAQLATRLHPDHPHTLAEVVWAVEEEMALTVEDVLARRVRLLFIDARAAVAAAPAVATIMAQLLGHDADWIVKQVGDFTVLAKGYMAD